ncbi:glycosyltransferase family 4 protein [Vibrio algarum]|uniref:Glycosyltransferase family 4 protein n=1 Tax=Vibrio algarum TaxID=3020714 RepID=A0ABT4YRM9_9VIBR|nr:glycosyltransferase family 4 protein [Vibrio sp. KJ40-1]MDB1124173.1 glycosyltransferase family 4 protein [Vibrio sp. KJ40-1]
MNILLAHFRVGETDGVSLEMDKWKWALEAMGHHVFYLAGSAGSCEADLIPALHYLEPFNDKIISNAYVEQTDYDSDEALIDAIEERADTISESIIDVIRKRNIDVIVPNNIWSLGYHLPAAMGLMSAVKVTQTKVICHHHDFHWERVKYSNPTSSGISELLDSIFPPNHPLVKHCVINRIAQKELKERRNIDAVVVPNVFDFHGSDWKIDEYNQDLRSRFGIQPHDVMFLQATRIVARKGIELAIDLLDKIEQQREILQGRELYNGAKFTAESRLILVLAGMCEEESYLDLLKNKAQQKGVELLFINDWVGHSRSQKEGAKVYSLWDVYCHADIITYPSLLEGWGNQFLEGLIAKLPMVVYRYPVYDLDIADYKFDIIDLGNTHKIDSQGLAYIDADMLNSAANETITYLFDNETRNTRTQNNYLIGEKKFSYPALKLLLGNIFTE